MRDIGSTGSFLWSVLVILTLVFAGSAPVIGDEQGQFSHEDHETRDLALRQLVTHRNNNFLTLTDPDHLAFVEDTFVCAGLSTDNRPALFKTMTGIAQGRTPENSLETLIGDDSNIVPINIVESIGRTESETAEPPRVYRRVKHSKGEPYDEETTYPRLSCRAA